MLSGEGGLRCALELELTSNFSSNGGVGKRSIDLSLLFLETSSEYVIQRLAVFFH